MSLEFRALLERGQSFRLDVDLRIATDRITALSGPSGSGKTSILRLIAGLDHIPGVTVRFDDLTWQDEQHFVAPHAREVGYVFQHLNLFPHLDVSGNLDFAERRKHRSGGLSREEVIAMLTLEPLLNKTPAQLSGGEQQRAAIARALMSNPRLMLMDEPLGSIDADARSRILPYLQKLHTHLSIPVIYVSHSLDEILYFSDEVISLKAGTVVDKSATLAYSTSGTGIEQPDAAAIITCVVEERDDQMSLLRLSFEGQTLFIADEGYAPGNRIQVRIPARDVSVAREQPPSSSILNIIRSSIEAIHDPGDGPSAVLTLKCNDQRLLTRITRRSLHELQLQPGDIVYAQIKGVALMSDYEH